MARRFRRMLVRLFPLLLALFGTGGCTLIAAATGAVDFNSTPAVANPLSCKLLKASAYAYQVNASGPMGEDNALARLLGESGEGYAVVSSSSNQSDSDRDAAYLWLSGKELIIAFRGTLPYNPNATDSAAQALALQDWINDADFSPQADPDFGPVHAGFLASFDNLWPGILQQIQAWQAAGKLDASSTVYVTGHSKGGALARLAALKLKTDKLLPVTEVDTFGAPRVGGAAFAARYAAAGLRDERYENQDDVVPHVPLNDMELTLLPLFQKVLALSGKSSGDYVSVGQLHYIKLDGSLVSPTTPDAEANLDETRLAEFASVLANPPQQIMDTVIAAHSLGDLSRSDDSRYFQAVCGAGGG
ncbi:MAG TPA: hypothetical protein VFV77_00640 [Gammaproteobacteria bacterium]|nr:hypothetical protein [Gammaproteobacteria bacterium]